LRESCQWQRGCYATATGAAGPLVEDRLWRPEKAAWYLDVKTSWIYEAVRTGRLPGHRVGRHIRFTRHTLAEQAKV
jgi:excisionase family DNA binding protein